MRQGCQEAFSHARGLAVAAGTTVIDLLPLAIGQTSVFGARYFPMARTVMGGLIASTVLTLLVLPTFYTLLDDLAIGLRRLWLNTRAPQAQPQPVAPAEGQAFGD